MQVIETNISSDFEWCIRDYQSRVIEVPSWQEYIDLFTNYDGTVNGKDYKTSSHMYGSVLPSNCKIMNLKYDTYHLSCKLVSFDETYTMKLAYLVR